MKEKEEENKDHQSEMPNFKGMFEGATLTNCTQNFIWGNETVHVHSDVKQKGETGNENADNKEISKDQLAHAIENCQEFFWGKASYAVVFCVCRDDYKMTPNMSAFERKVELLPYKKKRDYVCKTGTITNAFSDNSIYYSHIDKWEEEGADERQIKLRDVLRMNLTED